MRVRVPALSPALHRLTRSPPSRKGVKIQTLSVPRVVRARTRGEREIGQLATDGRNVTVFRAVRSLPAQTAPPGETDLLVPIDGRLSGRAVCVWLAVWAWRIRSCDRCWRTAWARRSTTPSARPCGATSTTARSATRCPCVARWMAWACATWADCSSSACANYNPPAATLCASSPPMRLFARPSAASETPAPRAALRISEPSALRQLVWHGAGSAADAARRPSRRVSTACASGTTVN